MQGDGCAAAMEDVARGGLTRMVLAFGPSLKDALKVRGKLCWRNPVPSYTSLLFGMAQRLRQHMVAVRLILADMLKTEAETRCGPACGAKTFGKVRRGVGIVAGGKSVSIRYTAFMTSKRR